MSFVQASSTPLYPSLTDMVFVTLPVALPEALFVPLLITLLVTPFVPILD